MREGRDLVVAVSAATGFPDPSVWPQELLEQHTRGRQEEAAAVWIAKDASGRCIGHALIERDRTGALASIPALTRAESAGLLFELGAVAVEPKWQGRGIATALVEACSDEILRKHPSAVLAAAVWPDGPSATWAERRWQFVGESSGPKGQRIRVFRRH